MKSTNMELSPIFIIDSGVTINDKTKTNQNNVMWLLILL
jgi:hypothetical protein